MELAGDEVDVVEVFGCVGNWTSVMLRRLQGDDKVDLGFVIPTVTMVRLEVH